MGNSLQGGEPGSYELCLDGTVWQLGGDGSLSQLTDLSGITALAPGPGLFALYPLAHKNDGTVWIYNDDTGHYEQAYGLNNIAAIGGGVGVYYAVTS